MDYALGRLQDKLRELSLLVKKYRPDYAPQSLNKFPVELQGFSQSKLTLAVYKETTPVEFAAEQATFMMFLGEQVCPKILAMGSTGYAMEYLKPGNFFVHSLCEQEMYLYNWVWSRGLDDVPFAKQIGDEYWRAQLEESIKIKVPDWALDTPCLIHGDPTLDNTLSRGKNICITDPIPPHRLIRPSIKAIDQSKILQSFLGWEVVLRGAPQILFSWPGFMQDYDVAKRAVFWTMVGLKRITLRNRTTNAGKWAFDISKELEQCMSSF